VRLLEAIIAANHRATGSGRAVEFSADQFASSLPIVALTCIDPRLNHWMPRMLGVPDEHFIWLRNAGNIIFDPLSSMMRTLSLACALKGGREIAVIGHTDCKVGKTSVNQLIDCFQSLGIDRARLPDNLVEFFGLFSSESQNVINGVGHIRRSPLISPGIPVHGLIIETDSGRLDWIVNGYCPA
jgi:carbonic anhydrase